MFASQTNLQHKINELSLQQVFVRLKAVVNVIKKPLLITHPRPDGDAAGSVLALKKFFEQNNKVAAIYSRGDNPPSLPFSAEWDTLTNLPDLSSYDAIINLDRGDNLKEFSFQKSRKFFIINVDHHPDGFNPAADINIVQPALSSTCEIIYSFLKYLDFKIDSTIAFYLLAGIFSDTGGFRHANTTKRVFEIAAELIRPGTTIEKLSRLKYNNDSLKTLRLWGIALDRAEIKPNGAIVTFVTQKDLLECEASEEDVGLISELLNTVREAKFSLVLSERENGEVKGSLRSEIHKRVDVSNIAHSLGGGGHKLAAGFSLPGKIENLKGTWQIV